MKLKNWGNYPKIDAKVQNPETRECGRTLRTIQKQLIGRGLGRCYGDSSLAENVISSSKMNRFLDFNDETGDLICESGVSLEEILDIFVPLGWFLTVTPGTKFVTVGGAIASDVHGKNHHNMGSFSRHVQWIELMIPGGEVVRCSTEQESELFHATCGGMGLTGIILKAAFRLQAIETAYIRQQTYRARNFDEVIELFQETKNWTYSVAWIDCLAKGEKLGRSVLMTGEHAKVEELHNRTQIRSPLRLPNKLKLSVPFNLPPFTLNRLTMRIFNLLFYGKTPAKPTQSIIDYESFFYPLDSILNWNRIYGSPGFLQYQFVLPMKVGAEGLKEIWRKVTEMTSKGHGSFLTVLKKFGKGDKGTLSFPMEGFTLAIDFAVTPSLFPFLDELDQLVLKFGGRIYLAKDARMKEEFFKQSYPGLNKFLEIRNSLDPKHQLESLQSRRLGI